MFENELDEIFTIPDDYCLGLKSYRYWERKDGLDYESLLQCSDSSQEYFGDCGQVEVVSWHSMEIHYNLRPGFPD